jgi:5-methyltetrahydrofolate--homocysteine methyltransferase
MFDLKPVVDAVITGNEAELAGLVRTALDRGVSAKRIMDEGLLAGMDIVGDKMENEEIFIPEVLKAARAMGAVLKTLAPLLAEEDVGVAGSVLIGTVKGDLHDIGKNLVKMMLEGAGFKVFDLGVDVGPERFVAEIKAGNPGLICLSSLLTTTMPVMKKVVDSIVEHGFRDRVKIMVGGAPVTQQFADRIGADGFAADAGSAVKLAKAILRQATNF